MLSAHKAERAAASAALGLKMEEDPLLLRAARGEKVEYTPVWMMRQAGRHMQVYRDLVKKYPTFRERSEIPEISTEISLQPWEAYGVDGCIYFSDILTPLPGMGTCPHTMLCALTPRFQPRLPKLLASACVRACIRTAARAHADVSVHARTCARAGWGAGLVVRGLAVP